MLFDIVFQLILEVRHLSFVEREWLLYPLESADDLCLITTSIGYAEKLLRGCKLILRKYVMEIACEKMVRSGTVISLVG